VEHVEDQTGRRAGGLWPDYPLVPAEWADDSYQPQVVAAIAEGHCPKHLGALAPPDGYCPSCRAGWELTMTAGTASSMPPPGGWPPFAVTDGTTVLVSRDL